MAAPAELELHANSFRDSEIKTELKINNGGVTENGTSMHLQMKMVGGGGVWVKYLNVKAARALSFL